MFNLDNNGIQIIPGFSNLLSWTFVSMLISFLWYFLYLAYMCGDLNFLFRNHQPQSSSKTQSNHKEPLITNDEDNARRIEGEDTCPICMERFRILYIQTNCGHYFCASCFSNYFNFHNPTQNPSCPICRQSVNMLLSQWPSNLELSVDEIPYRSFVNTFNRRFGGGPRTIREKIQDIPYIVRHAFSNMFTVEGILRLHYSRMALLVILSVIYTLLPFDFLPDYAYGVVGILDDIFLVFILVIHVAISHRQYLSNID